MLPSTKQMYIVAFVISSVCLRNIISCGVHVCLTWEVESENITFKCKVSDLRWNLFFVNPAMKQQGYCLSPLPFSECYPSETSNLISQDRRTNTTVLIIRRHEDGSFNGPWKCIHGTKQDQAVVNVTIIHKVTIKTVFDNDNCFEEYMAWTFISIMACLIIILVLQTLHHIVQNKKIGCNRCNRDDMCRSIYMFCSKPYNGILKLCVGILFILLVIFLPYISGNRTSNCKDKHYFLLFGCFVVLVFVICWLIPRKDKLSPSYREDANEDVNIELRQIPE